MANGIVRVKLFDSLPHPIFFSMITRLCQSAFCQESAKLTALVYGYMTKCSITSYVYFVPVSNYDLLADFVPVLPHL